MENFINCCLAEGCTVMHVQDLANAIIPPAPYRPWETGCIINIPKDIILMGMPFGNNPTPQPFILAEVVFPDGETKLDKVFLSTLIRTVKPYGGNRLISSKGEVVDYIRSFPTWDRVVEGLREHHLRIEGDTAYEVECHATGVHKMTHIYDFSFVH